MNTETLDHRFMARALQLAKKGQYTTSPNPYVGCVLVKSKQIIAEGHTQIAGQAHAEVNALDNAQESTENATAYVTLEPCSHIGKTPPCVDALIKAGINRVVIAMLDPNPKVSGRGVKKLLDVNIDVSVGILEDQARQLNRGFFKRMEQGLPFVRIKMAMSLDGKTAMASGESQWITGDQARHDVQRLRAQADAILTGSGTILDDNPSLNLRLKPSDLSLDKSFDGCLKQPLRVVLDTHLNINESAKILGLAGETLIYSCENDSHKIQTLSDAGAEIKLMQSNKISLLEVLEDLADREINDVHVEAGATLCGALLDEKCVDEIVIYMAPTILGGNAKSLFNLPQLETMKDQINLNIKDIRAIGNDWRITAVPIYPD